ncbi:hypothetical protein QQS21_009843 [Conoideocrella luteorostrata]|uniref:Clr5 domain-containing protein n=1 Tax=Conoideocrella luteorostrata TaxID=1105319 RepID=A0AAJ0CGD1_9HYPO|nr:hypothetical protein QQS21_009843 [Conoideocrella luteorostrata]
MASSSQQIPQDEWEQHRDTILSLRFSENLPLNGSATDDRSVMQVMLNEHHFQATVSQYEAQLKRWAAPKNLKKRDWESILPAYDELKKRGLEPRIRLGDQIFTEKRIKRARRYVNQGGAVQEDTGGPFIYLNQPRAWVLEARRPDCEYAEYSADIGGRISQEFPPSLALMEKGTGNDSFDEPSRLPQGDLTLPPISNAPSSQLAISNLEIPSPQHSQIDGDLFSSLSMQDFSAYNPPFVGLDEFAPASPWWNEFCNPVLYNSPSPFWPLQTVSKASIELTLERVIQEPKFTLNIEPKHLQAQIILDKLESLLHDYSVEENSGDDFMIICCGTSSMSDIHTRIIASIIDNFAGLEGIPPAIILGILRIDAEVSSRLFESLRSNNLAISKPLADNLFRAAVEACDEEAVGIILESTSGRMNEVDLDRIICQFEHRFYSPLALASHLHNFRIVEKLLEFGARVSVANMEPEFPFNGCALTAIFRLEPPPVIEMIQSMPQDGFQDDNQDERDVVRVVELLLTHGAEASTDLLGLAMSNFRQSEKLVEMLYKAVPQERHSELFDYDVPYEQPILYQIAYYLEDHTAYMIIKSLMVACGVMNCEPTCTIKHSQHLGEVLTYAILDGKKRLIKYLLGQIQPAPEHLAAAIHSENLDLIDFMFTQGICTHGEAMRSDLMYRLQGERELYRLPTTPLAEAIRLKNDNLIRRLEEYGALEAISDRTAGNFEAAALATVEVGNFPYLKRLLALVPAPTISAIYRPISKSIEIGNNDIAKMLIIHYARGETDVSWIDDGYFTSVLGTALEKRNKDIVETLIEYFGMLTIRPGSYHLVKSNALREAAKCGDFSILKDVFQLEQPGLISRLNNPAIKEAISTQKIELAIWLLEMGVHKALHRAISAGCENITRLLLNQGADPADDEAFSAALDTKNHVLLSMIYKAFSSRYPDGINGFGGKALQSAILSRDDSSLDALLKIKFDTNSYTGEGFNGAPVLHSAIYGSTEDDMKMNNIIRRLLGAGADPEAISAKQETAMLAAIQRGNLQVLKMLIKMGSNLNRPARHHLKRTPLQQACEKGSFKIVEFLLDNGADVNAPPAVNGGATALQLAAIQGSVRIMKLLLHKGANIHAAPAVVHGRTALEGAAEHGRVSALNFLLSVGGAEYTIDEMKSAKLYAEKKARRGCEEILKLALFRFGETRLSRPLPSV